jgi:hypothetical protein
LVSIIQELVRKHEVDMVKIITHPEVLSSGVFDVRY